MKTVIEIEDFVASIRAWADAKINADVQFVMRGGEIKGFDIDANDESINKREKSRRKVADV